MAHHTLHVLVLPQHFVTDAVKLLLTKFIALNPADLGGWMTDPEGWFNMEGRDNDLWESDLRVSRFTLVTDQYL